MAGKKLKLISWNVNGLRAVLKKGFIDSLQGLDADIFAIQETKLQEPQLTDAMRHIEGYESYWSFSTVKKGYSGVGIYTRLPVKNVNYGIGIDAFDQEGRILEIDFDDFIFLTSIFRMAR